jgi:hypothetical protein
VTDTQTVTLAEFLLARIAEDEKAARDEEESAPELEGARQRPYVDFPLRGHLDRHTPARVLAECEAKRRIVELHQPTPLVDHMEVECTCGFDDHRSRWCAGCGVCVYDEGEFARPFGNCPTVLLLALPYADHPDYRQEWAV